MATKIVSAASTGYARLLLAWPKDMHQGEASHKAFDICHCLYRRCQSIFPSFAQTRDPGRPFAQYYMHCRYTPCHPSPTSLLSQSPDSLVSHLNQNSEHLQFVMMSLLRDCGTNMLLMTVWEGLQSLLRPWTLFHYVENSLTKLWYVLNPCVFHQPCSLEQRLPSTESTTVATLCCGPGGRNGASLSWCLSSHLCPRFRLPW